MKRPTLIATGIVIILFMVGIWVYLLAYGAPKQTSEVFTNLGVFEPVEEIRTIEPELLEEEGVTNLALDGSKLEQLTTKAVAGYIFSGNVFYVERGTGYIFEIDIASKTERQISPITVPQAASAVFSPNNTKVAITSYTGYESHSVLLPTYNEVGEEARLASLPVNAQNIAFEDDETLYYTITEDGRTFAYAYNTKTLKSSQLFTTPLIDPVVYWGNQVEGIYVHTKPSTNAEGYVYEVQGSSLVPVFEGAKGLTAFRQAVATIVTYIEDAKYRSTALWVGYTIDQALAVIPEKCVVDMVMLGTWCAAPVDAIPASYLEDWYKGAITSEDQLWYTQFETGQSIQMANLSELSGRTIDVSSMKINTEDGHILFTNKPDASLWLYRIK